MSGTADEGGVTPAGRGRRWVAWAIALGALVLAAALGGALWWRSRPTEAERKVDDVLRDRLARLPERPADPIEAALLQFYRHHGRRVAWSDGVRPSLDALRCVGVLRAADSEGLDPGAYSAAALHNQAGVLVRAVLRGLPPDTTGLADFDLQLSRSCLRYARDVHDGRLPSAALDPAWVAARDTLDLAATLRRALDGGDAARALADLAPARGGYRDLRLALARYRAFDAAGGWPALPAGTALRRGAQGPAVVVLRRRLAAEGESTGTSPAFDAGLAAALSAFQARHGLRTSGVVDSATRAALNVSATERVRQIAMNLERARWLPDSLPEPCVIVSLADFTLELRDSSRAVLRSRVVVGEPRNPTPVFSARLSYIVVNPTWRLPKRILVEETLPALARDTSWLARHQMRVLYTHAPRLTEVPRESVNWTSAEEDTFPYVVVQDPGDENPLGRIKLMCPNPYDVYLHDTPAKGYFSAAQRAYSHGCVRVQKARELAEWLLARDTLVAMRAGVWRGQPRPPDLRDSLQAVIDSLATRQVGLKEKVPVHFLYRTAWPDSSGAVQFRDDLYGLDRRLGEALSTGRTAEFVLNPPVEWGEKHRKEPLLPAAGPGRTQLRRVPPAPAALPAAARPAR